LEQDILSKPHQEATLLCEELIRAYDPCISCSVHFLTLTIDQV
jgi:coenzyme F420-reducing hydrogenase alpha subunit